MISVRYIVADVDEAVAFYQDNLDFKIDKCPSSDKLRLWAA